MWTIAVTWVHIRVDESRPFIDLAAIVNGQRISFLLPVDGLPWSASANVSARASFEAAENHAAKRWPSSSLEGKIAADSKPARGARVEDTRRAARWTVSHTRKSGGFT